MTSKSIGLDPDEASAQVVLFTASPLTIQANGIETSSLTATVRDAYGNNVGANVSVQLSTELGFIPEGVRVLTDNYGIARATLRGEFAGTTVTKARVDGPIDPGKVVNIELLGDPATASVVQVKSSSATILANDVETSTLTATVRDIRGDNVGSGVTVSWSTNLGTLSTSTSLTDTNGIARATIRGPVAGSALVRASAVQGSATTTVKLIAP
jgi:adhesin/invasin